MITPDQQSSSASIPFQAIRYLLSGTPCQQAAYRVLQSLKVFEILEPYRPLLAGTIPLDIDTPGSDLDLLCQAMDLQVFQQHASQAYGNQPGFRLKRKEFGGVPTVIANFSGGEFPVEMFAQPVPVQEQRAYRHLLVEDRLLRLGGSPARQEIRRLKLAGMKTEPAFAAYFHLRGDPYLILLELGELDEAQLRAVLD
jgi:hypothetical protein